MRIGIISDIHEDAERLNYAVSQFEKLNCDEIICLGDVSGFDERFYSFRFSKNLNYCIDILKVNCRVILPGNHDLYQIKRLPANPAFPFPPDWYELSMEERKKISNGAVWLYEKETLISHPNRLAEIFTYTENDYFVYNTENYKILFSHSIFPDISGVMTKKPIKVKDFRLHIDLLRENNVVIGVCGHLHPNGLLRVNSKVHHPKFSELEFDINSNTQFICPCIADGIQDNGYTIIDTINNTLQSFPIRTPKNSMYFL